MFHGSKVIPKILPRNRWMYLNSNIKAGNHCQEIFGAVEQNIRTVYVMSNYVAVDEWVPFYKGKNPWGVWMKCKPSGMGFKVYVIADTNGIPYSFILYQGISLKMADVVLRMEETLPKDEEKRVIVVDSFFGGEDLANELNNRGRYFIMAMKSNSSLSQPYKQHSLHEIDKGEWMESTFPAKMDDRIPASEEMLAVFFRDKKDIFLISNFVEPGSEVQRHRMVPTMIHLYNQFMGCVDLFDSGNWGKMHKFQDYSRCLCFWIFRAAVTTAWRYWCVQKKTKVSQRSFIELIIQNYLQENKISLASNHKLISSGKRLKCVQCKVSSTSLMCQECNVPLHYKCIENYHASKLK